MKVLNRTITILSKRLDEIPIPERMKDAVTVANELDTLREAVFIIEENAHVNVPDGLDDWDRSLILLASNTRYIYHRDVRNVILTAHSTECQSALKKIADLYRDLWRRDND